VVERDAGGAPTGILREEAAWRFEARAAPGRPETLQAMREALPAAAAAGVVAIHDKDGGRHAPELFAALQEEGALTLRVWQSVPDDHLAERTAPEGAPGELLRVGYVKAFMDGTLGSRTARLLDGTGVEITSAAALAEIVRRAATAGFPVAVHAIGDRANREALDAFAATRAAWSGLRPRIEHAQCVHPLDVPRFAALGVAASVQYSHATSDRDVADRLWEERAAHAYPYRSLLDAGTVLAGGSDAPVEPLDPLAGLRAAVRRTDGERPPWRPEQAIPAAAALASYTTAPAWLAGEEDHRGRLAPGLLADLTVLDRDPLADLDARVLGTMLAGRWTLTPPGSA
jgi:predicted amidohydrolase YtcJ